MVIPLLFLRAESASELQNKIDQKNADIAKLEREISKYQNEINDLGKQKSSLNNSLKELDLSKKKLIADMTVTQKKIDATSYKIQALGTQINDKQGSINNNTSAVALGLQKINEFEQDNLVQILVSENDFTSIWNDVDSIMTLQEKIRGKTTELKQVKGQLEDTRKVTIDAKNELVSLKNKLADQKKIVDQNTIEKKKLLTQTKNNEANYQKLVKDRKAKKEAFEKEIEDYEAKLKYVLDPSSLPGKGVLSWPLDYVYITSNFGPRWGGMHRGLDFRASVGTPVFASADGIVAGSGNTDLECAGVSYGKFILIKYDNGLAATYGHLSLVKVSKGQRVSRGEVVGYSGNTGSSTGPHLHISVYPKDAVEVKSLPSKSCPGKVLTQPIAATNAYLDPAIYFPKK